MLIHSLWLASLTKCWKMQNLISHLILPAWVLLAQAFGFEAKITMETALKAIVTYSSVFIKNTQFAHMHLLSTRRKLYKKRGAETAFLVFLTKKGGFLACKGAARKFFFSCGVTIKGHYLFLLSKWNDQQETVALLHVFLLFLQLLGRFPGMLVQWTMDLSLSRTRAHEQLAHLHAMDWTVEMETDFYWE